MKWIPYWCVAMLLFTAPVRPQAAPQQEQQPSNGAPPDEATQCDARIDALTKEMTELKANEIAEFKQAIEALQQQVEAAGEDSLDDFGELDELEMLDELGGGSGQGPEPIEIHGFYDLSFFKFMISDDSAYAILAPSEWSFIVSQVNLYFTGQMSSTLHSLVEAKLAFLPHGMEYNTASYGKIGDTLFDSGVPYERASTMVADPHLTNRFNYGSVTIERAHLTYSPYDWLNILAGRFLTPYGIWNIDHGSPVIIPVRAPYMQLREMVPLAQTGLQVFGRFFPSYSLFIDYAVTVSNGRGPIEELVDLDANKGIGLRLRVIYEGEQLELAVGGHGYYGKYTDIKKASIIELNPDLTINTDVDTPLRTQIDVIESYGEYILSGDLQISLFGVTLQSEAFWRLVLYEKHGLKEYDFVILSGAAASEILYHPNHIAWGAYGMIYWELPLSKWIHPVTITPFAMFERTIQEDTLPGFNFDLIFAGLNIKPSPYVVLKLEYSRGIPHAKTLYGGNADIAAAQLAVSF